MSANRRSAVFPSRSFESSGARDVLNGVLWVLRTGAPWHDLPERYPPYHTCHRRFQRWAEEGVLVEILRALAEDLKSRGGLDLSECFIDATFMGAKKGEDQWEKTKRGKGTKLMALADASGLPISICTASASPHEVTLVEETLRASFVEEKPERLIGDRAYEYDPLDAERRTGVPIRGYRRAPGPASMLSTKGPRSPE
jgi:transposase